MDKSPVFKETKESERERKGSRFALIVIVIYLLMQLFLIYPFANRVEPFVLGLPFFIFWVILWILIGCAGLFVAYMLEYKGRRE